ncbi:MAG: hypothetical protein HOZ81_20790 [Streptomyces sp.]|nr:hypothetical protein [Streptomyces sp.]
MINEIWGEIGGGSSFTDRGRRINLLNGKLWDKYSYGRIESGRVTGDRVWVDRSINTMPLGNKHPSTSQVQSNGGWKQCGPETGAHSFYVLSWHRAVRVCWDPTSGDARCGAWYVDQ